MQYDFTESLNNKKQMAKALNAQGISFRIQGDYVKAIDYFTRSLKIEKELGDKNDIDIKKQEMRIFDSCY
jgi:lipoprotein NlpI